MSQFGMGFGGGFGMGFGGVRLGSRLPEQPLIPPLAEQQAASALSDLTSKTLGGLQYLGETLDKPGRAVRGTISALAGGPAGGGLLNLIPFSDTIGLTDPRQGVSGRDLLERAGALDPNAEGFHPIADPMDALGDVAGFGTELALDPLSYLSMGAKALTPAGTAAMKTGKLAKTTGQRIAQGQGGLVRFGLGSKGVTLGTGPTAQRFAQSVLDPAVDAVKYGRFSPVPATRALFDRSAHSQANPAWQRAYDALGGRESELKRMADQAIYDAHAFAFKNQMPDELVKAAAYVAEGLDPIADLGLDPAQAEIVKGLADLLKRNVTQAYALRGEAGHMLTPRQNYFPRYSSPLDDVGYQSSDIARDPVFNLFDSLGGTKRINEMFTDQRVAGLNRPWSDTDVADILRRDYLGGASQQAITDLEARYAKHMADRLTMPDDQWKAIAGNYTDQIDQATQRYAAGDSLARMLKDSPYANAGRPMFGNSPLADFSRYMHEQAGQTFQQEAMQRLLADNALQGPMGLNSKPAKEALAAAKLTGAKAPSALAKGLAKKLGVTPKQAYELIQQNQIQVPREIVDLVSNPRTTWKLPQPLQKPVAAYDKLTNLTKGMLTSTLPAGIPFNVRNRTAGELNNWLERGAGGKGLLMAQGLARGDAVVPGAQELIAKVTGEVLSPEDATLKLGELAYVHNVAGKDTLSQSLGQMVSSPGQGLTGKALPGTPGWLGGWKGIGPWLKEWSGSLNPLDVRGGPLGGAADEPSKFIGALKGEQLSAGTEGINRLEPFINKLDEGYIPSVAADVATGAHFDYSDLSRFEAEVMKRLFPFYSFARKNAAYQADKLATDPARTAAVVRGLSEPRSEEYSPAQIREKANVSLGTTPSGAERFITGFGLPIEEATGRFVSGPGGLGRTADQVLAMLNTIPRTALESMTGRQFFSGRDLADLDPLLGRLTSNASEMLGGKPFDREQLRMYPALLEQMVSASPLSRVLSMARTAGDTRKDLATKALALGTGIKIQDVSPEEMKKSQTRDAKEMAATLLGSDPTFGKFERFYLDKDKANRATPEQIELMRIYNLLKERDRQTSAKLKQQGR